MANQDQRTPVQRPAAQRPQSAARPAAQRPATQRPAAQRPQNGAARTTAPRPQNGAARLTYNSRPSAATRPGSAGRPPQKPRKKTVQPRFFVFLAILLVVVVAAVFGIVKLVSRPDTDKQVQNNTATQQTAETSQEATSVENMSQEEIAALTEQLGSEEGATALSDSQRVSVADLSINEELSDEWINVLLLGTDERKLTDKGRTDTMIICSVNRNTGKVKLSSIQRDLAVDFAELGYSSLGVQRANSANFFGGPEMAMKMVNEMFGMNVQNYVLVNFFGFQDAVNAVGGITLDITENEMNKINVAQKQVATFAVGSGMDISGWDNEDLTTYGPNTRLNGQQALGYARIRKLDSDFGRSDRQRKVLIAMLEEVKQKSAVEIAQLGATMMPYLSTNMNLNDIMNVAMVVLQADMEVDTMRLPVNGSYLQEKRGGQDMLWDCDFVQNEQELYQFIYNK